MVEIRVKYLRNITPLTRIEQGSWIDLRCGKDIILQEGQYAQIPLGIAMELPEGFEAIIAPRSSTFRKYGVLLANSIGVVDNAYNGDGDEWHFLAYATRKVFIPRDERICQFRILRSQSEIEFLPVKHLGNPDRGGLGSTDKCFDSCRV